MSGLRRSWGRSGKVCLITSRGQIRSTRFATFCVSKHRCTRCNTHFHLLICRKKAKKVFGKTGAPDSPRLQNRQKWGLEDQEQWIRQDQFASVPQHIKSHAGSKAETLTSSQRPQQDDWYTAALQQSAQLSELAKQEQAEHDEWVEQEQRTSKGSKHSQEKLRHRGTAAQAAPQQEDWFNIALQQSAQLDAAPKAQIVV